MDAAQVIAKTMAAANCPLTEDQQIVLAGALAVCMEKAVAAERERCAALIEAGVADIGCTALEAEGVVRRTRTALAALVRSGAKA